MARPKPCHAYKARSNCGSFVGRCNDHPLDGNCIWRVEEYLRPHENYPNLCAKGRLGFSTNSSCFAALSRTLQENMKCYFPACASGTGCALSIQAV